MFRWFRFVVGGGLNTAITYGLYLLLNIKLDYQLAYALAFAVGIIFSYVFNSLVVFRRPLSFRGLVSYPTVYVIQYLASAVLLGVIVEFGLLNEIVAPLFAVGLTIPITYVVAKFVIQKASD